MAKKKIAKILMATVCLFMLTGLPWGCDNTTTDPESGEQTSNSDDDDDISDTGGDFPIIADHTVVALYDDIPQEYIDIVKTWLVDAAGESHSEAYRTGMTALAALDSGFQAQVFSGSIPSASTNALRLGRHASVGEEDFWTNTTAVNAIKTLVANQETAGNPIDVIFQAWCWDLTRESGVATGGSNDWDTVYGCHWYGSSSGGPDGDHIWGLDDSDAGITGNSVSLQTYLDVIEDYNDDFETNNYDCRAVFTTGPVDGQSSTDERGYQRYIKHEAIRSFVRNNDNRVLFDYADILCYNDDGEYATDTWTDYNGVEQTFPMIHSDNAGSDTGHIGNAGALRLAKAMWWMLARMAGWDGES